MMRDLIKLGLIQVLVVVIFLLFRWIRTVVHPTEPLTLFELFLLSFPNFCESVVGVLLLTCLGLWVNQYLQWNTKLVYGLAALFAGIIVLLHEIQPSFLGGANIYDPNDILFSVVGTLVGTLIVVRLQPNLPARSA